MCTFLTRASYARTVAQGAHVRVPSSHVRRLSWEEFERAVLTLREQGHQVVEHDDKAALRVLFDGMDTDQSGTIEMDEYFLWTLQVASMGGNSLESVFQRYDKSGEGVLDAAEFALAAEDMGFSGSMAHSLFAELDHDKSGAVSYKELVELMTSRNLTVSSTAKKFVTKFAFSDEMHTTSPEQLKELDTGQWKLEAKDSEALRLRLREGIEKAKLKEIDLYNLLRIKGDKAPAKRKSGSGGGAAVSQPTPLTEAVFVRAMTVGLGFRGDNSLLSDTFQAIDSDGSGYIGLMELHHWLTGRAVPTRDSGGPSSPARNVTILPPDKGSLAEINWTPNGLLQALQAMMRRCDLSPVSLVRAYDRDGGGTFDNKEFLVMLKALVRPKTSSETELWYSVIRPTVVTVFNEIGGADRSLDMVELVKWLGRTVSEDDGAAPPLGGAPTSASAPPPAPTPAATKRRPSGGRRQSSSSSERVARPKRSSEHDLGFTDMHTKGLARPPPTISLEDFARLSAAQLSAGIGASGRKRRAPSMGIIPHGNPWPVVERGKAGGPPGLMSSISAPQFRRGGDTRGGGARPMKAIGLLTQLSLSSHSAQGLDRSDHAADAADAARHRPPPRHRLSPRRKAIRDSVLGLDHRIASHLTRLARQRERLDANLAGGAPEAVKSSVVPAYRPAPQPKELLERFREDRGEYLAVMRS